MRGRRFWLKTITAGAASLLVWRSADAQQGNSTNSAERLTTRQIVPLDEQLRKGLRAFRPEQIAFVNIVVANVNQGKIPRAMVNLVFRWARERNPRIPFPYFEFALKALAKRRGVNL